jgi:hypothetical protein
MMAGDHYVAHSRANRPPRFLPLYFLKYPIRTIGKKSRSIIIPCHQDRKKKEKE